MFNLKKSIFACGAGGLLALMGGVASAETISNEEMIALMKANVQSLDAHCSVSDPFGDSSRPMMKNEWLAFFDGMMQGTASMSDIKVEKKKNKKKNKKKAEPQVVYLDFETGAPDFPVFRSNGTLFGVFQDYEYSQAQKDEIQRRIEADFEGLNLEFTQELPTEGPFFTLQFNDNDAGNITVTARGGLSILFGRANEIDFGNDNFDSSAFADASLWTFLAQLDPSGGLLEAFSGGSIADFGGDIDAFLSFVVVNQSANTGAHEIGHTLGLRHYDPFGAPGNGLPSTGRPARDAFIPAYEGFQDATETVDHLMASGASSGLTLAGSALQDRFFSERSLNKLVFNDKNARGKANIIAEESVGKRLKFKTSELPNTLSTGLNAGAELTSRSVVVEGSLDALGEVDSFTFKGKSGQVITAEVISGVDIIEDDIFPRVSIYYKDRRGNLELVGVNDDEFESFDSLLLDLVLPYNGDYVVQVDAPDVVFAADINGDGVLDPLPYAAFGLPEEPFRLGDYSLHLYTINADFDDDDDDGDDD